jgi:UvrD/REP helicase N-terminal domain
MDYIATTQPTAEWLLGRSGILRALADELMELAKDEKLTRGIATVGPLRATASKDGRVLAVWHTDYLGSTGAENWGVLALSGPYGLFAKPELLREVFERYLHVTDRRLQSLMLDASWWPRTELAGVTTCIAGRGDAREGHRIAYVEGETPFGNTMLRSVLVIGPAWENSAFRKAALDQRSAMHAAVLSANVLLSNTDPRPAIEHQHLQVVRKELGQTPEDDEANKAPAISADLDKTDPNLAFTTLDWGYDQWIQDGSPLTKLQRQVLTSDALESQPLRLLGAAGSGKTLLMMLLAIRQLRKAKEANEPASVLYVAHNSSMRDKVYGRFLDLGAAPFLESKDARALHVCTLFDYATRTLNVSDTILIDKDAQASKEYQGLIVGDALQQSFSSHPDIVDESVLFSQAKENEDVLEALVALVGDEFSLAIKGNGLNASSDRKLYVGSQRRLSRLHGILTETERNIIWEVFLRYQEKVADEDNLLDADDLALSLLGRLRTPLWELRRRADGFDFVFVDEAQLFNENERRLFPLLTRRSGHVPVALALDQAQQTKSLTSAGLGLLGLEGIESHTLRSVHRSSVAILKLAFFMLQRTTDLFGVDFPDFTSQTTTSHADDVDAPNCIRAGSDESIGSQVERVVGNARRRNHRQVAVVVFAERYWESVVTTLKKSSKEVRVLASRGETLGDAQQPVVVISRPEQIGGQEFDCVVCVGLEQGVVPVRVSGNDALSSALEQQSLREMYLAFTRSRTELSILVSRGAAPNAAIADAISAGLVTE